METDIGNPIEYNPTLDEQEKNEDNKQEEQYYFHPSEMTYAPPPPAPPPPTEGMDSIFTWIFYGENHATSDPQVQLSTLQMCLHHHKLVYFSQIDPSLSVE